MKIIGAALAFGGLALAAWYVWLYPLGNVMEMPLRIQTRGVAVTFGVGAAIVGTLLYGFSSHHEQGHEGRKG